MNHISNQASMDAYRGSGVVKEYEFLATLDDRTSEICQELDGKVFTLAQGKTGVNMPPMHPYCRSTTIPHFPEDELSESSDRIARDENGKSYFVGENVTFKEWVDRYAEASYAKRVARNSKQYTDMNTPVELVEAPDKIMATYEEHAKAWMNDVVLDRISESEAQVIAEELKKVIENNDFCMRVKPQALRKILADGEFKNQIETGTSNGSYNPNSRKKATNKLFGADVDNLEPKDFETYGYLGLKDKHLEFEHQQRANDWAYRVEAYGSIIVTLKKDQLMGHVTYTTEDSLGPALLNRLIAGNAASPSAVGISKYELKNAVSAMSSWATDNYNPFLVADSLRGDYIELQYTRKMTLDDIESIALPGAMEHSLNPTIEKLREELKEKGINIIYG
jgi:hypothetical protein